MQDSTINSTKRGNTEATENIKFGYPILAQVIGLVSQEIYSRFNAMLTANSIIIALIGLLLINKSTSFLLLLSLLLSIIGLILCVVWGFFNYHGVYWQDKYKKEAKRIEKFFHDGFQIWSFERHPWLRYYCLSTSVIAIFAVIYFVLAIFAIFSCWATCCSS
jgi:hypothetical protein